MQASRAAAGGTPQDDNAVLKTYEKKVREDVRSVFENMHEMLKLFKVEDEKRVSEAFL